MLLAVSKVLHEKILCLTSSIEMMFNSEDVRTGSQNEPSTNKAREICREI